MVPLISVDRLAPNKRRYQHWHCHLKNFQMNINSSESTAGQRLAKWPIQPTSTARGMSVLNPFRTGKTEKGWKNNLACVQLNPLFGSESRFELSPLSVPVSRPCPPPPAFKPQLRQGHYNNNNNKYQDILALVQFEAQGAMCASKPIGPQLGV
jgi:hypothetical protein